MYLVRGYLWIEGTERLFAPFRRGFILWRTLGSVGLGFPAGFPAPGCPQVFTNVVDGSGRLRTGLEPAGHRADRVEDRRVVAVELAGDLGKRERGELAREVHGELACLGDLRDPAG